MEAAQQRHAEAQELIRAQMAQPVQPEQQPSADPVEVLLAQSGLPERAQIWLRAHPEYLVDARKNSVVQYHHYQVAEQHEPFSDAYFDAMEVALGLRSPAQPNGHDATSEPPATNNPAPPARKPVVARRTTEPSEPAPVPQPTYSGPPISAPPSRETHSMVTGQSRPSRITLSAEEQQIAWDTRPRENMSQDEAFRLYAQNKQRYLTLRSQGQYPSDR
jgi:hypothetical protein